MQTRNIISILLAAVFLLFASLHAQTILQPNQMVTGTAKPNELALFKVDQTSTAFTGIDTVISGCTGKVNVYINTCAKADVQCDYPTKERHSGSITTSVNSTSQGAINSYSMCFAPVCSPSRIYMIGIEPAEVGRNVDFQVVLYGYNNNEVPTLYTQDDKLKVDLSSWEMKWQPATYCSEYTKTANPKCKTDTPVPNAKYTVYYTDDASNTANLGTVCGTKTAKTFVEQTTETKATLKVEKNSKIWVTVKMESADSMYQYVYPATMIQTSGDRKDDGSLWKFLLFVGLVVGGGCCACICTIAAVILLIVVIVKVATKPTYTQMA